MYQSTINRPNTDKLKYKRAMLVTARKPDPGTTALHYGDLRPPLGLGYIATVLEQNGVEVHIVDNYMHPQNIKKEIDDFRPEIIGLYMHSPGYYVACDLIREIKQYTPVPLIVGGPQASLCPETIPKEVDHICKGEGEFIFLDICKGVQFPHLIDNATTGRISNLNDIPFPDYKFFWGKGYNWNLELYGQTAVPVFTMHTSRSCPYRCSFCGVSSIWSRRYTFFSAERIVHEIDHYVEKYGCKGIYFREDLFTANRPRVKAMCELLLERPYKIMWACESRADITDPHLLELMKKSGCVGLYLGVEAGSDTALIKKQKDLNLKTMRTFFEISKKVDIKTYATFCMGTPGETEEEIKMTLDFIDEVRPTSYDKFAYLGLPKSKDYHTLLETNDYYHIDSSGIVYSERFYEMAHRLYHPNDQRLYFLKQQKEFLRNYSGQMSREELSSHRFPPMDLTIHKIASSTANEFKSIEKFDEDASKTCVNLT